MKGCLTSLLLVHMSRCILAGFSQYYYQSALPFELPSPVNYIAAPCGQTPGYHYTTPAAYFQRNYVPSPFLPINYHAPPVFQYSSTVNSAVNDGMAQTRANNQQQPMESQQQQPQPIEPQQQQQPQVQARTSFSLSPSDAFRGFAYHTALNEGASANVIFLTGPEARLLQNHQTIGINVQNQNDSDATARARTFASDSTDPNAQQQMLPITRFLSNMPEQQPLDVIRSFLSNPQPGVHNFFSGNNQLISRNIDEIFATNPASAISLNSMGNQLLESRAAFTSGQNDTANNTTGGEEQAASSVQQTRVNPQDNTENTKEAEISSTAASTAVTSTTLKENESTTPVSTTTTMGSIVVQENSSESTTTARS